VSSKPQKNSSALASERKAGYLFALPWIIGFLTFLSYPLLSSLYFSLTRYSILKQPVFVGFENYRKLFLDDVFLQALGNTFVYAVFAVPLSTIMAITLALLLNAKVKGQAVYRTLFYIPSLVPMVVLGLLWKWIFNAEFGILNAIIKSGPLGKLGIQPPNWLGDPFWAKVTLILIAMWGVGNTVVIYLAGLQDVPASLYEAAEIDGASPAQRMRKITLPMISPVIQFNGVMGIIGALQVFAVPFVMFPGGAPARSTYFFSSYLFDTAFKYQKMGYASAMGWVLFIITVILTFAALKLSEKHVVYDRSAG
jgi:multiple sugar transport system permease protein